MIKEESSKSLLSERHDVCTRFFIFVNMWQYICIIEANTFVFVFFIHDMYIYLCLWGKYTYLKTEIESYLAILKLWEFRSVRPVRKYYSPQSFPPSFWDYWFPLHLWKYFILSSTPIYTITLLVRLHPILHGAEKYSSS